MKLVKTEGLARKKLNKQTDSIIVKKYKSPGQKIEEQELESEEIKIDKILSKHSIDRDKLGDAIVANTKDILK